MLTQKQLNQEVRTSVKNAQTWVANDDPNVRKMETPQKRCFAIPAKQNERKDSRIDPKNDFIVGVAPPGTPLVAQPAFGH